MITLVYISLVANLLSIAYIVFGLIQFYLASRQSK